MPPKEIVMPYKTIHGREVKFAYEVAVSIYGSLPRAKSEEAKAWLTAYQNAFDQLSNLDCECVTLREENKRLRYENEFMLRLVNDREQAT